jgi:hypothetical protein
MKELNPIIKSFEQIGARVKVSTFDRPRRGRDSRSIVVDVKKDRKGEFFDIRYLDMVELLILDTQPKDKHLLLMARDPDNPKAKFLCGHDERHWFTASIPENLPVSTVTDAKQALKPKELIQIESGGAIRKKDLQKRRRKIKPGGKIYRQGEFMFVPDPNFKPFHVAVIKNEILSRGGNPHRAQYLYREGGETVYINNKYPNGLTKEKWEELILKKPEAKKWGWQTQVREPAVYVKGKISHPEHATIDLGEIWHRVLLNTESQAKSAQSVAFID